MGTTYKSPSRSQGWGQWADPGLGVQLPSLGGLDVPLMDQGTTLLFHPPLLSLSSLHTQTSTQEALLQVVTQE